MEGEEIIRIRLTVYSIRIASHTEKLHDILCFQFFNLFIVHSQP